MKAMGMRKSEGIHEKIVHHTLEQEIRGNKIKSTGGG